MFQHHHSVARFQNIASPVPVVQWSLDIYKYKYHIGSREGRQRSIGLTGSRPLSFWSVPTFHNIFTGGCWWCCSFDTRWFCFDYLFRERYRFCDVEIFVWMLLLLVAVVIDAAFVSFLWLGILICHPMPLATVVVAVETSIVLLSSSFLRPIMTSSTSVDEPLRWQNRIPYCIIRKYNYQRNPPERWYDPQKRWRRFRSLEWLVFIFGGVGGAPQSLASWIFATYQR